MTQALNAITPALLSLALDAASQRHQAIATNIANVATEGYTPLRLNFEEQLGQARRALAQRGSVDAFSLAGVRPMLETVPLGPQGAAPVQLDAEVAAMSQNAVQYQALAKGLSKHFAILSTAVNDGRK